MNKKLSIASSILVLTVFIAGVGKTEQLEMTEESSWTKEAQVLKTIKNVKFNFPATGFAFDNKSDFVEQSLEAMQSNAQIIGLDKFTDTIHVRFLKSKEDMFPLTGMKVSGTAFPHISTIYVVVDGKQKPPIFHELMHLIAMLEWGYPHPSCDWLNEGLATFAENNCNGYNVAQIYRFFLETDRLIEVDSLISDFYKQSEMIGYHQSSYMAEYLLNNYGLEQFKKLWIDGFDSFQTIYGVSFAEFKIDLERAVMERYPSAPDIDFEKFDQGCK